MNPIKNQAQAALYPELHEIVVEFHRRAFGEEMARVNFLPLAERKAYLARLRARAAQRLSHPGAQRSQFVARDGVDSAALDYSD